jgi:hypothetical protein
VLKIYSERCTVTPAMMAIVRKIAENKNTAKGVEKI